MTDTISLMRCAFCWAQNQAKPDNATAESPVSTHVARHKDKPDQPYWICAHHAEHTATDPDWTVAPAEPQSIELTVFSPSGTAHTTHVLVCGSGQGDGDTGEHRSEGSR